MGGAYFWVKNIDDENVQVYYSGMSNGKRPYENVITFDYEPAEQYYLTVAQRDVDEEVWDMLLQVLDLEAS